MAVRRSPDFSTLYWIDSNGFKVEVHPLEGAAYSAALETMDAQIFAKRENLQRRDHYLNELANQQISVDASRPYSVPQPPQMIIVNDPVMDDFGTVTPGLSYETEWNPPLPGLKLKTNVSSSLINKF